MSTLWKPLLAKLEGGEHEQISALVVSWLPLPNAVHDVLAKCQLRHRNPRMSHTHNGGATFAPPTLQNE
jgi:hypothetical protein